MMKLLKKYWHVLFLVAVSSIPFLWFLGKGDILITGLDTNFPLNPLTWFLRRLYVWNSVNNAGVDFSSSTAGLFFHLIQLIPFWFGLGLKHVEIISMIFWFSAIVTSSFILSQVIVPKNRLAQVIFVSIYSINTYLFNTWENVKVSNLSLVAALPLFIALVYYWANKKITTSKALLYLTISSIVASGAGINPAYLGVIVLSIVVEIAILLLRLNQKSEKFYVLKIGILTLLVVMLVNAFWIMPLINFLFGNKAIGDLGFTDWLVSLSQNTSIVNVIRLQGAWDWYALDSAGMPQYLPYTLNYLYKFPFIIFSFALPFLSFLSYIFIKKNSRYWYIFLGSLALLGIFFGVGAHSPTGSVYLFFSKYVPFFSFFRSPWYIFTPLLVVAYSGLTSLLFDSVLEFGNQKIKSTINIFEILFLISYFLYNYPLINGKIFRPNTNGFYIKFPDYVLESESWLSKLSGEGRVISYPDDQLESFDWGYKGTESILSLFSDKETITPSFNNASKSFSKIQELFYSQLKRKEYGSAISLLNLLGADQIFYKRDVPSLNPPIDQSIEKFVETKEIGRWSFMTRRDGGANKIFTPTQIYKNLNAGEDFAYVTSILGKNAIIVNQGDTQVAKIPFESELPVILKADNVDSSVQGSVKQYSFKLPRESNYTLAIERQYLDIDNIIVSVDSKKIDHGILKQNDSLILVGPLSLESGEHLVMVKYPIPKNIVATSDYLEYSKDMIAKKDEPFVDFRKILVTYNAEDKIKVVNIPLNNFNEFLRYKVEFDYKYFYGNVPIIEITQSTQNSPVKSDPIYPGSTSDWGHVSKLFKPVETNSKLEILIKMFANGSGRWSKSYFENLSVTRIYDNKVFVVEAPQNNNVLDSQVLNYKKISPVKYEVELKGQKDIGIGSVLSFLETYNTGWRLKVVDGNKQLTPIHFSVNGYANAWYVPSSSNMKVILFYQPQYIFLIGCTVSVLFFLGSLLYFFINHKIKSKK